MFAIPYRVILVRSIQFVMVSLKCPRFIEDKKFITMTSLHTYYARTANARRNWSFPIFLCVNFCQAISLFHCHQTLSSDKYKQKRTFLMRQAIGANTTPYMCVRVRVYTYISYYHKYYIIYKYMRMFVACLFLTLWLALWLCVSLYASVFLKFLLLLPV